MYILRKFVVKYFVKYVVKSDFNLPHNYIVKSAENYSANSTIKFAAKSYVKYHIIKSARDVFLRQGVYYDYD